MAARTSVTLELDPEMALLLRERHAMPTSPKVRSSNRRSALSICGHLSAGSVGERQRAERERREIEGC